VKTFFLQYSPVLQVHIDYLTSLTHYFVKTAGQGMSASSNNADILQSFTTSTITFVLKAVFQWTSVSSPSVFSLHLFQKRSGTGIKGPDDLAVTQPTVSKHWRKLKVLTIAHCLTLLDPPPHSRGKPHCCLYASISLLHNYQQQKAQKYHTRKKLTEIHLKLRHDSTAARHKSNVQGCW